MSPAPLLGALYGDGTLCVLSLLSRESALVSLLRKGEEVNKNGKHSHGRTPSPASPVLGGPPPYLAGRLVVAAEQPPLVSAFAKGDKGLDRCSRPLALGIPQLAPMYIHLARISQPPTPPRPVSC